MLIVNDIEHGFSGSEELYKHSFSDYVFTQGVQHVAEKYSCYWLIDAIFSHQVYENVNYEEFQVWSLKRIAGYEFLLNCEDGNDNFITSQRIPFSDFKADEVTFYLIDNTLLLPSEN